MAKNRQALPPTESEFEAPSEVMEGGQEAVAKIPFLEDDGSLAESPTGTRTAASLKEEQRIARAVIDQMNVDARNRPPGLPTSNPIEQKKPREMTVEEIQERTAKLWVVEEEREIAKGASRYKLKPGKIISENEYNVPDLKRQGVKLRAVEA